MCTFVVVVVVVVAAVGWRLPRSLSRLYAHTICKVFPQIIRVNAADIPAAAHLKPSEATRTHRAKHPLPGHPHRYRRNGRRQTFTQLISRTHRHGKHFVVVVVVPIYRSTKSCTGWCPSNRKLDGRRRVAGKRIAWSVRCAPHTCVCVCVCMCGSAKYCDFDLSNFCRYRDICEMYATLYIVSVTSLHTVCTQPAPVVLCLRLCARHLGMEPWRSAAHVYVLLLVYFDENKHRQHFPMYDSLSSTHIDMMMLRFACAVCAIWRFLPYVVVGVKWII